jgi:hypothetical protein
MLSPRSAPLFALLPLVLLACGGGSDAPPPATAATAATSATVTGSASLVPAGSAGSTKAEMRTNRDWAPCHAAYKLDTSDLTAQVDAMAKGCASVTGMHSIAASKGKQAAANPPQAFGFHAEAGHCYRAYAVAETAITDLDLVIKDSTGAIAGEDSTDDPTPVVLENGAVCFKSADDAQVMVSVGSGQGSYAVQVWGD